MASEVALAIPKAWKRCYNEILAARVAIRTFFFNKFVPFSRFEHCFHESFSSNRTKTSFEKIDRPGIFSSTRNSSSPRHLWRRAWIRKHLSRRIRLVKIALLSNSMFYMFATRFRFKIQVQFSFLWLVTKNKTVRRAEYNILQGKRDRWQRATTMIPTDSSHFRASQAVSPNLNFTIFTSTLLNMFLFCFLTSRRFFCTAT